MTKRIRFITDSTADIADELLARYPIDVVPVFVNFNGESYADDNKALQREDYYRRLGNIRPFPTTSAMPPAMTERAIRAALEDADHVICVTASSKLSGVHNAFRLGAQKFPADKVTLIDSLTTTAALGWAVVIGAETAADTGDVQKSADAIRRALPAAKVYAALGTLEFLHRSGRVGWAAANIGSLLQIKPIIGVVEGEVVSLQRVRTFSRALDEIVRYARDFGPMDRLTVLYGVDIEPAQALLERIQDIAPPGRTFIVRINPAVGTHIGPTGLGIVPVSTSWKKT